jgi:hypothetical protein
MLPLTIEMLCDRPEEYEVKSARLGSSGFVIFPAPETFTRRTSCSSSDSVFLSTCAEIFRSAASAAGGKTGSIKR